MLDRHEQVRRNGDVPGKRAERGLRDIRIAAHVVAGEFDFDRVDDAAHARNGFHDPFGVAFLVVARRFAAQGDDAVARRNADAMLVDARIVGEFVGNVFMELQIGLHRIFLHPHASGARCASCE